MPSFFTDPLVGSLLLFPAVCASCLETMAAVQLGGIFFLFTGVTDGVGRSRGQHMGGMFYNFLRWHFDIWAKIVPRASKLESPCFTLQ